jgi:GNAT superfamily N-acetyltransferase
MSPVTVERRREADAEDLFRMYGEVFGGTLSEGSRRRFQWQYLEGPAADPAGPEIWVARDGDALLGQYASMPVRLHWGGREVRSSWGMDVFLRPEARGRGVGAQLFTTWSDHVEVALGLGLTPSSYGLFKKLRYDDVGPVPFFQKVLDPAAVLRRRLGAPGVLLAPVLRLGLALRAPERLRPDPAVTVAGTDAFGPDYDTLWERAQAGYAMCVRRDAAYLDWKYVRCPHQRYDLWEARRAGELVGFAVTRDEDYRGLHLGWIVDLFTSVDDGGARGALLAHVLRVFRERKVARVQAFAMNGALQETLRSGGFRPATSPMQFCVRARAQGSEEVLRARERWHVVFGDSDMDRS